MMPLLRSLRFPLLLILLPMVLTGAPAAAQAGGAVRIELRAEALITGRSVRLGDVATVSTSDSDMCEAMKAMRIDSAPRVGYVYRLSRARIERALRSNLLPPGGKVDWRGAQAVAIRAAAHLADTAALAEAARQHLIAELGRQFDGVEAELAAPLADFELPVGEIGFRPRPVGAMPAGARQPVWVDVLVDGTFYRSVVVPFQLLLRRAVPVARRDLPEDTMVSAADFEIRMEDVSDIAQRVLPAAELRGTMRVKKRIARGEVVMRHQLSEDGTVQPGDMVKLVLAAGGVLVETRAVAQQHAVLGQEVKVKPDYSLETVSGRVVASGVVQAE